MDKSIFKFIADGARRSSGEGFFALFAKGLVNVLGVKYMLLARRASGSEFESSTVLFTDGEEILPDITYDIRGTPCENVVHKSLCIHEDDVDKLFPEDKWLIDNNIKSYFGMPLYDLSGEYLGHVAVVGTKKFESVDDLLDLFMALSGSLVDELIEIRNRERLDLFFSISMDIFCIASLDGHFLKINPAFAKVLGYSEKEILKTPILEFIHPDDRASTILEIENQIAGSPTHYFENRYRRKDGVYIWLAWNASFRPEDGQLYAVARDITQSKKAGAELLEAKEAAEKANKAKSIFLSSMTHEIRTPLTSVMGFSQLLTSDEKSPLQDYQKKMLEKIIDSGEGLLALVNDILYLSKLESEKTEPAIGNFAVEPLVKYVVASLNTFAQRCEVRMTTNPPAEKIYVLADNKMLVQSLENLVSNAIKYNRAGNEVTISWDLYDDAKVRICVSDNGVGIAEDKLDKLFMPFDRLGIEGQNIKGTGIGLTIVKRLVDLMHGAVGVKSKIGKGAVFYIDLPVGRK